MLVRLSKIALVAGLAVTCSLAVYGNVVDPATNLDFTRHVLAMDTIDSGSTIRGRAVTDPGLQFSAFAAIVTAEAVTALLLWVGAARMAAAIATPAARFARAKAVALAGLTLGFLVWQTGFLGIGGEWFAMWMSKTWNGQEEAFRFTMIVLGVLTYVALPDEA